VVAKEAIYKTYDELFNAAEVSQKLSIRTGIAYDKI